MGSCSSEQHNGKGTDASVGGLVWVRRGNGSWWPGQIMDVDEASGLPNSSGVPIKLLGRDDVTVDWYNLEMTKKVKAFRCGEYASCIEKAKASLVNPVKKRPKHARRENAILLALELETSIMSKDCENCSGADNFDSEPNVTWSKSSPVKSNPTVVIGLKTRSFKEKSDSAPELSHSGISYEEANTAKIRRQRTPNDSEDDGNEGIKKRMKGLDDLGMGSTTNLVTESAPQGVASVSDLSASNCLSTRQHVGNGSKGGCMSFFRKKRSKVLFHDILKRKNRRRMLTKVLQNDTLVSVPIIFDDIPSPRKSSNYDARASCFESNDSKRSPSAAVLCSNDDNNDSNSTGVSFEDTPSMNDSEDAQDADYDRSSMSELIGYDSLENLFDVPLICEAELCDGSPLLTNPPLKLHNDGFGGHMYGSNTVEVNAETNEAHQEHGPTATSATAHVSNHLQKTERGPSEWQLKGRRNSRHQNRNSDPDLKTEPKPGLTNLENDPDQFSPSQHKMFSYRQSRFSLLPRYEIPELSIFSPCVDSVLYDVHIEVKARYRPQHQHVPYISLMSKLNGKPITGHPITVEVLEDGECDVLVDEVVELNEDGDEVMEPRKDPPKKELVLKPYFSPSKSPKNKKQGSSSKKTRRLSALTASHGKRASNYKERLVIRNLKAPALACIPLKVVFSRINEALNGSTRSNQGS
ncbi:hypothetical protein V2J09_011179 [Rumex salicifolius]